jgi:hypothetical protein
MAHIIHRGYSSQRLKVALSAGFLAAGLVAFWYNLSFIRTFFAESSGVTQNYLALFPWKLVLLVIIGIAYYFFAKGVIKSESLTAGLLWWILLFFIVYIYYVSAPPEMSERRLEYAPQALRLMTGADMAFALLLATLLNKVFGWLKKIPKLGAGIGVFIGLIPVSLLVWYGWSYIPYGREAISGQVDLAKTSEYRVAAWLKDQVKTGQGERVLVTGNHGFYLNYFTNIWQLRGGLYQAITHPWVEHIYYQLNVGKDQELALAWLKIANIKYLVVPSKASQEMYQDIKVPEKFQDLELVNETQGDLIYKVPLTDFRPAKIVSLQEISAITKPKKADDKLPILAYAGILDHSRPADFRVENNNSYQINGQLQKGEAFLIQMTYDPGFRAKANSPIEVYSDPFGFMLLVPEDNTETSVHLYHRPTVDMWLGYLITVLTLIVWLLAPVIKLPRPHLSEKLSPKEKSLS